VLNIPLKNQENLLPKNLQNAGTVAEKKNQEKKTRKFVKNKESYKL
jgi:hypothetical protein